MINAILCFILGHKLHHNGEFRVVDQGRFLRNPIRQVNVFRCFRCGCEVAKEIKK